MTHSLFIPLGIYAVLGIAYLGIDRAPILNADGSEAVLPLIDRVASFVMVLMFGAVLGVPCACISGAVHSVIWWQGRRVRA